MSAPVSLSERSALDELEPRWRRLGYTVVREPAPEQLPGFLKNLQPDAIAIGAHPSLVIEVLRTSERAADSKFRQIRDLIGERADWRLEAVYLPPGAPSVEAVDPQAIHAALAVSRSLADAEPRVALLLAWATLEAIVRRLEPDLGARPLAPRSLIDLLVSNGHLDQDAGRRLWPLADLRHVLAHGQIDRHPPLADITWLIEVEEQLAATPGMI